MVTLRFSQIFTNMASKIQVDEVLQQINDSDWCESDDDLIGNDQVGDIESFSCPREDPLDRPDTEVDEDFTAPERQQAANSSLNDGMIQTSPVQSQESSDDTPCSSSHNASIPPDLFQCTPGPISSSLDSDDEHPFGFFCKVWGADTFKEIADQTNLYALQKGTSSWEEVSEQELRLFIGMQMGMGLVRLPSLQDYWSTNSILGAPGIVKGMGRNRFRAILSHLHLNDNTRMPQRGDEGFDKLYKIRPLLERVRINSQLCYQPHQQLAVDEAMILFKGRSSLKQYMPLKPVKRGYKAWCICDSTNGYMYNLDLHTGASIGSLADDDGLGSRVVQKLMEPLYNLNHHVYMDNFFSSVSLATKLKTKSTYMIGTARSNRKRWPASLKDVKGIGKAMSRGESRATVVDGVECIVWKDNKAVALVNTISNPNEASTVPRRNKDGSRRQVPCPKSVELYNKYMGGVDLFDSRRKTYSSSRKSKKWWLRIYYFLLDTAATNAYVLYKETPHTKALTQKEFTVVLVEYLLGSFSVRKRSSAQLPPPASRLRERHFPDKISKSQQYRVCKERRRTMFCCKDCYPSNPIPLCPTDCFRTYHTKVDISHK